MATAQQFLNDLARQGPQKFIDAYVGDLTGALKDIVGYDFMRDILEPMMKDIEGELTDKYKPIMTESFKIPDEKTAKIAIDRIQKLAEPILLIVTLQGQTLLEQSVVLGVTAYETYIGDTVESLLRLNPTLFDKFSPELRAQLGWDDLRKHGKDWREASTAIILDAHRAFDLAKVKELFRRLADIDNVFGDAEKEESIVKFLAHRHLIVHRAGRIDRRFKEITGSRQALNSKVELTTSYVTEGIETLGTFAEGLQGRLESTAGGVAETEPPDGT